MKNFLPSLLLLGVLCTNCTANTNNQESVQIVTETKTDTTTKIEVDEIDKADTIASAATILDRQQVPILCYHRIHETGKAADYTVLTQDFKAQLKLLADSGYHSVLPDQLYDYLTKGKPLPERPFMITFDDTHIEHYTVAAPELEKHGFKGVFFCMTIPIGKPNYMSSEQIKSLSDRGHVIGSHTWDHHNVKKLQGSDWQVQIEKPKLQLEKITGKPVEYFAYPFGVWNDTAASEIEKYGFKSGFQLTQKRSTGEPLYTIRRTLVPGSWPTSKLLVRMNAFFQ
jgi:peptidoglycan/xylan/chitin deacetylase (PgdA/CDA1 family)